MSVAPGRGEPPHAFSWAAALVAAAVLVFFLPIALGKVFVSPDSVAPAGFSKIALEALSDRRVYALWNPYHFLGMPSFGSLAFVPYVYPLDALFGFLHETLRFPDLTWLLAHYLLLGLSMLALLRTLGAGPLPAALGSIAFALTPNLVAVGAFGHGSQIMTAAYLPLLVLLLHRFLRRGSLLALAGFALAAALQLLRGHVQIVFYSWLALGSYALVQGIAHARGGDRAAAIRALAGLTAGLVLAFGMSAFLYLPTHEYAKLSIRSAGEGGGAGFAYATSWSFSPREMLTFVIPGMFGFGGSTYWGSMPFTDYPNYMGILPLALAVYGAWTLRGPVRLYFVLLAIAALLISFGKHLAPLYSLLYYHVPFFNKFRVPVMILVLTQFSVAALAALGLTRAWTPPPADAGKRRGGGGRDRWLLAAAIAAAGGVAALVLLSALAPAITRDAMGGRLANLEPGTAREIMRRAVGMASSDALKSGLFLAAGLAVIGLYRRRQLAWGVAAAGLLVLWAGDLWIVDRRIIDPQVGSPAEYREHFERTPEVDFLRSDSTLFRVLPLQWNDSRLAAYGIASVLGYHPAKPRLYQAFMDTVGIRSAWTLRFLNVKYILTDGYIPPESTDFLLRHDGAVKVYEVEGALPRAQMLHRLKPVRDDGVALATLHTGGLDTGVEALWTEPGQLPPMKEPMTPDSVRAIRYDFNECDFLAATAAPGIFLLRDQWDPDWTARVDGSPARIYRVDYLLRGVLVGPGVHRIAFRYEPKALALGFRVSVAALLATLLLALAGVVTGARRRRAALRPAAEGAGGAA
ncbi:MAG TPA: hypothetical protein VID50_02895 [Candidatus Eisenbacteria bacterium]